MFRSAKKTYDYVSDFNCYGLAEIALNSKKGVINKDYEELVPPKYEVIYGFRRDGLIEVDLKGKKGLFDTMGNQIIQPKYDVIFDNEYSIQDDIIIVKTANKTGVLNIKGEEIIPFRYIRGGLLVAEIKIIDICNHVIVPFMYDEMDKYHDNLMKVKLNDKHGIIDIKGNIIIPIKCELMSDLTGGFFVDD